MPSEREIGQILLKMNFNKLKKMPRNMEINVFVYPKILKNGELIKNLNKELKILKKYSQLSQILRNHQFLVVIGKK